MNKNSILIEAIYELKSTRRSILFRIFILLSIVGLGIYYFTDLFWTNPINELLNFSLDPISQSLPCSIAYKTAYYFNFIQLIFVVVFIINDSKITKFRAMETMHTRPLGNREIVTGTFIGKLFAFTIVNFIVFAIAILVNVAFYPHSFDLSAYFFYWATLNLPALVYFLGISYLINRTIHLPYFSMMIIIAYLGVIVYWGAGWTNGVFDPCARYIPNVFSSFTGHVNLENYLLQRGFILLTGGGFLALSVIPYPRIPNYLFSYKKSLIVACAIFFIAGGFALTYTSLYYEKNNHREAYKQVYDESGQQSSARVVSNTIHLKELENGNIQVNSHMVIENTASVTIPLVIYLNPALKVNSVDINGQSTSFRRRHQALFPDKELNARENIEISINYEGNINNDICFLDTDPDEYNAATVNQIGIYHFGYSPAFCQKGYKLLTPECIWYPVCVPPYGETGIRNMNFSRYSLKVEHDPRLKAISQGNIIRRKEGETVFTFDHDMPGISLCIGNYKKRTIVVDSTRLSLYYLPEHDYLLEKYSFPEDKLIQSLAHIKNDLEAEECIRIPTEYIKYVTTSFDGTGIFDPRMQYPYRWLTLLEVPCNFHCFPGRVEPTGERVQGGIAFLPEKMYSIENYRVEIPQIADFDKEEYMLSIGLNKEIKAILGARSCSIKPVLRGKTTFIFSHEYPIISDVLSSVAHGGVAYNITPADDYLAVEYLKNKSLNDALHDKSLPAHVFENIIRKKSEELHMYLTLQVGEEQYRLFYLNFLADNLFKETSQEEFFRKFYSTFSVCLDSLIEKWYNTNKLAILDVRDAQSTQINGSGAPYILFSFKVFNRSDIPGLVTTDDNQGWVIPPHEGREIRTRDQGDNIYRIFSMATLLTQNLPTTLTMKREEAEYNSIDTTTGIFNLNSFSTRDENEIIVDNEDPGFRVVKHENFITSLLRQKKSQKEYHTFMTSEDTWLPMIKEHFYGFPVKSALLKVADSGKQKVEWNFSLPQKGKYEAFFYYTTFSGEEAGSDIPEFQYYTVFDGKEEHEISIPIDKSEVGKWISLGVFHCLKDAKVTLSDKASNKESYQTLVADAVKFVKVKE